MTAAAAVVTTPRDTDILITREFDAPVRLVWRAYTEPELVRRWWAGDRGTVRTIDIDLTVGGGWRYTMTADGGFEVNFRGVYAEIVPGERLVYSEIFEGLPDPDDHESQVTVTFAEKDGRTYLEMLCHYRSQEDRDAVLATGMEDGMQESLTHLERVAGSLA